jgi:hypothetical protein
MTYRYTSVRDYGLPLLRSTVEGLFAAEKLDAIVYPTSTRRPALLAAPADTAPPTPTASATNIANLTGFPDLIVPAGFTGDNLPVYISFFGPAFTEKRLLSLGYSFEQATRARRRPVHTPALEGNRFQGHNDPWPVASQQLYEHVRQRSCRDAQSVTGSGNQRRIHRRHDVSAWRPVPAKLMRRDGRRRGHTEQSTNV